MRDTEGGRDIGRERSRDSILGSQGPEPKADAQPLSHPSAPNFNIYKKHKWLIIAKKS